MRASLRSVLAAPGPTTAATAAAGRTGAEPADHQSPAAMPPQRFEPCGSCCRASGPGSVPTDSQVSACLVCFPVLRASLRSMLGASGPTAAATAAAGRIGAEPAGHQPPADMPTAMQDRPPTTEPVAPCAVAPRYPHAVGLLSGEPTRQWFPCLGKASGATYLTVMRASLRSMIAASGPTAAATAACRAVRRLRTRVLRTAPRKGAVSVACAICYKSTRRGCLHSGHEPRQPAKQATDNGACLPGKQPGATGRAGHRHRNLLRRALLRRRAFARMR